MILSNEEDIKILNQNVRGIPYIIDELIINGDLIKSFRDIIMPAKLESITINNGSFDFVDLDYSTLTSRFLIQLIDIKDSDFSKFTNLNKFEVNLYVIRCKCVSLRGLKNVKIKGKFEAYECKNLKSLIDIPDTSNRVCKIQGCPLVDKKWEDWINLNYSPDKLYIGDILTPDDEDLYYDDDDYEYFD